jgi:hypothetical protein
MEKNVYSIEEIFAGRFFTIPDYQRGYAWEREHCEDLLDDLDLLPNGFNHYTGTVVFHSNQQENLDNEGSKYFGYDIVDGQQRITSIVILLHAIQSFFDREPNYKILANGITKKFLYATRLSDGNAFYKLTLNADCKDFFKTDILGKPSVTGAIIRSHQRLSTAKKTFNDYLLSKKIEFGKEFYSWLIDFYNKVIQRLKVGIYIVDQAAEVGVIFEVMNNRGKDLTELEKVKNYLLYLTTKIAVETSKELADLVNVTWSKIYQRFMSANLGTESENQFLRAHWLMYANYNRKEWDGSKSIKGKYSLKKYRGKDLELFNELTRYVNSIDEASITFADLEKPERVDAFNAFTNIVQKRSVVFYSTKLLRTKTIASFRSLLIACRLKFADDAFKYLELVKLIEIFAFRVYNMQGKRADTGQSSILKAAYELYNDKIDYVAVNRHLRWLLNGYSSNAIFIGFWKFDDMDNNWYSWSPLKYFLYEYEEYLAGGDPLTITWSYFTERALENSIEHILPQTSEESKNYWITRFSPEQIKTFTHDLGNLCLTYNNSNYRNFGFDIKKGTPGQEKPCYANSSLNQERVLTEYDEWTPENIQKRRELITNWANKRWFADLTEFGEPLIIEEDDLDETLDDVVSVSEDQ